MVFDFVLSKGMKIFIEDKIYALDISLSNRDLPDPRRKNTRSAPSIEAMESANERIYPILLGSENNPRNSKRPLARRDPFLPIPRLEIYR